MVYAHGEVLFSLKEKQKRGWWDGSVGKGDCHQCEDLDLIPRVPTVGEKRWILTDLHICAVLHVCGWAHMHRHTNRVNKCQKIKEEQNHSVCWKTGRTGNRCVKSISQTEKDQWPRPFLTCEAPFISLGCLVSISRGSERIKSVNSESSCQILKEGLSKNKTKQNEKAKQNEVSCRPDWPKSQ